MVTQIRLRELPILIENTREILTLLLNEKDFERANKGEVNYY